MRIHAVRNWQKFQHYKHRRPPWIRLYRDIIDNMEWTALSGDAAKLLTALWVLASESDESGTVRTDSEWLAYRLRITAPVEEVEKWVKELVSGEFLEPFRNGASAVLAGRGQGATPEGEYREREELLSKEEPNTPLYS